MLTISNKVSESFYLNKQFLENVFVLVKFYRVVGGLGLSFFVRPFKLARSSAGVAYNGLQIGDGAVFSTNVE